MKPEMRCCRCRRTPEDIPGLVLSARAYGHKSASDFVYAEEGTLNVDLGLFACDECYIEMGQPSAPMGRGRWVADRFYELDEQPGTGPAGGVGTALRAFQDSMLRSLRPPDRES